MGGMKKLDWGKWLLKTALASGLLGMLLYYAAEKSVTVAEVNTALASIPLAFVGLIELFDKIADKNDYYNKIYGQVLGNIAKQNRAAGILVSILLAGFGMLLVAWALAGTITLNLGTIGPANIFVAGLVSLYIFAPETGDDELLLWAWIGATIATKGAYLAILPPFLLQMFSL